MNARDRAVPRPRARSARLVTATLVVLLAACSAPIPSSSGPSGAPTKFNGSIDLGTLEAPDRCDPLDGRHCLLPFPSDTFTRKTSTTATGKLINFAPASMPTNNLGVQVDPTELNRNDGFSPGQAISLYVPGIDLAASRINDVANIGQSLAADAGVVLLDATTGKRWPYWGELDSSVTSASDQVLYIRPARNFPDGHRIVVALRNLVDVNGAPINAGAAFRAYRDRLYTGVPEVEERRARYERVLRQLGEHGVARDDSLFIAWDFTVASTRNLTERIVHMRDVAFASIGAGAPTFTVDLVEDNPATNIARRVTGTFDVPMFLDNGGAPGSRIVYGADGLPASTGTYHADYICNIPSAAMVAPARGGVYGHGLLGSNDEVNAGNVRAMSQEHNFVFCATKWIGLSEEDIANSITTLSDISNMVTSADRMQQGILNTVVLARLVKSNGGLVTHPAFQNASGAPVIATGSVFYDGNSQGGIMGGAATAVSTEWTRAVLGVTGMNYSTLLQRSSDWNLYRAVFDPSYPNVIERGINLSLLQMLWDRGEANGYANHMTNDPLPGTPRHKVLMEIGIGDFQVSNWAALVEARTIGARLRCPASAPGRLPGADPYWNVPCIDPARDHQRGNVIVFWDSGTPAPPLGNIAPTNGVDSHEDPRADATNRTQKSAFLSDTGVFVDVCGTTPCTAASVG